MWIKLIICLIDNIAKTMQYKLIKYFSVDTVDSFACPITHIEEMYVYICMKCTTPHIVTHLGL